MQLSPDIVAAAKAQAARAGIEPAGVLTVIQTETGGKPFESADLDFSDGREPIMLFERHIFYRELKKLAPALLKRAVAEGLAIPKWLGPGSSQYADQRTSAGKLAVIARAVAIHPEAAYRATSMGLFQVCGFNAQACGYASAVEMHDRLAHGLVEAHIEAGIAFLRSKGLLRALAARDWKASAKGYNGTAYAKNQYDKKLAQHYAEWTSALRTGPAEAAAKVEAGALKLGDTGARVEALQRSLNALGIKVLENGDYGPAMKRAVGAAQVELGLTGTGVADPATVAAIEGAELIPKGARELVTAKDLRADGDPQVKLGTRIQQVGAGALGLMGTGQAYLATASDTVEQVKGAKETVTTIVGDTYADMATAWVVAHWPLLVGAGAAVAMVTMGGYVVSCAVVAHRTGRTV